MSPWLVGAGAVVGLAGALAASWSLGSRERGDLSRNPLKPCPNTRSCTRVSVRLGASPLQVRVALIKALDASASLWVGRPIRTDEIDHAFTVDYRIGPFTDRVRALIQPGRDEDDTWLHLRSSSRIGRSDLGVNQRRVDRLVELVREQLQALKSGTA